MSGTELRWLEGTPRQVLDVSWGVPWPRGELEPPARLRLCTADGVPVPVQSWPAAYWPDGSLKWTGHAIGATAERARAYVLSRGAPAMPAASLRVEEGTRRIVVDTGVIRCAVERRGPTLISGIDRGGSAIARDGHLVCLRRGDAGDAFDQTLPAEEFRSQVEVVAVEQSGPVRAVIRVEGFHCRQERRWLPFTVRLYFSAGSEGVRIVHSFTYDGDPETDFVAGLGIRFSVPLPDPPWDRHVRVVAEGDGLFAEAVQGLTGLRRDPGSAVRQAQVEGRAAPDPATWRPPVPELVRYVPCWGDYTIRQLTADGFEIRKRTRAGRGWIRAGAGSRAAGLTYLGGASGGLAIGLRNFWQLHPTQVDIRDAQQDLARLTVWLWAPDATPMDLRFYHDGLGEDTYARQLDALEITYEDFEPGYATAHGIARTSELALWALATTPSPDHLLALRDTVQAPPLLVSSPERLRQARVFGDWAPADRSTPARAEIEDHLDFLFDFHRGQVEQHRWYGFWDFGDLMHTYDPDRHRWRYDVGGFAWDNSELSPDLWLWYQFLRTGRADVFRLAEAMSRHGGEVDVYHLGPLARLGTRHGVQHFGDSAKQLRISNAAYRRIHYFLTADERCGDLLRSLCDSEEALLAVDPIRKLRSGPYQPSRRGVWIGLGTDWGALAAAWLVEWERTGDERMRRRLVEAMRTIGEQEFGFVQGSLLYDLETGCFQRAEAPAVHVSHLSAVFGLVEVCSELISLLDVPGFTRAWLDYCTYYNAGAEEQARRFGRAFGALNLRQAHSRLTAYAAAMTGDRGLATRAWTEFGEGRHGYAGPEGLPAEPERGLPARPPAPWRTTRITPPGSLRVVDEAPFVSTNASAQYALAAIQCLALIGDHLPPSPGATESSGT